MTIKEFHQRMIADGHIDGNMTERQFVDMLNDPEDRKGFYDFVQKKNPNSFSSDYNMFSSNLDNLMGGKPVQAPKVQNESEVLENTVKVANATPTRAEQAAAQQAESVAKANAELAAPMATTQPQQVEQSAQTEQSTSPYAQMSDQDLQNMAMLLKERGESNNAKRAAEREEWNKKHPFLSSLVQAGREMKNLPDTNDEVTPEMGLNQDDLNTLNAVREELGKRTSNAYLQAQPYLKDRDQRKEFLAEKNIGESDWGSINTTSLVREYDNNEEAIARIDANVEQNGNNIYRSGARYLYTKANEMLSAPTKDDGTSGFDSAWNGVKNFGSGLADNLFDRKFFATTDWIRNLNLSNIVSKLNKGEVLNDDESDLLNAYMQLSFAQQFRENDLAMGYKIGEGTADSAPFMVDMLLTHIPSSVGKRALLKSLMKTNKSAAVQLRKWIDPTHITAGRTFGEKAGNFGKYVVKEAVETPVQTMLMPSTWAGVYADKTQYLLNHPTETDWNARDAFRSFGNMYVETLTERAGGKAIDSMLGSTFNKLISKAFNNGVAEYVSSPIGEVGEEFLGAGINFIRSFNPMYSDESNKQLRGEAEQMFTEEGVLQTIGTVLPMTIFMGGANAALNKSLNATLQSTWYNTYRLNSSRNAIASMLKKYGATDEQVASIFTAMEGAQTPDQFSDYLNKMDANLRSLTIGNREDYRKVRGLMENYAQSAYAFNASVAELNAGFAQLSPEEQLKANETMRDAMREIRHNSNVQRVNNEYDKLTNEDGESIYNVHLVGDEEGKNMFVIGGKLVMNDDGTINKEESDGSLVVVDVNGNNRKMIGVKDIDDIQQYNAEDLKASIVEWDDEVQQSKDMFPVGSTVGLPNTDETSTVVDNEDGNVTVETTEGNVTFTPEEATSTLIPESEINTEAPEEEQKPIVQRKSGDSVMSFIDNGDGTYQPINENNEPIGKPLSQDQMDMLEPVEQPQAAAPTNEELGEGAGAWLAGAFAPKSITPELYAAMQTIQAIGPSSFDATEEQRAQYNAAVKMMNDFIANATPEQLQAVLDEAEQTDDATLRNLERAIKSSERYKQMQPEIVLDPVDRALSIISTQADEYWEKIPENLKKGNIGMSASAELVKNKIRQLKDIISEKEITLEDYEKINSLLDDIYGAYNTLESSSNGGKVENVSRAEKKVRELAKMIAEQYGVETISNLYKDHVEHIKELAGKQNVEATGTETKSDRYVDGQLDWLRSSITGSEQGTDNVPDWTEDNAAAARERGYRMVNGEQMSRQGSIKGYSGKKVQVSFSNEAQDKVTAMYTIVDANTLQPSHLMSGGRNPMFFITEAQPKERTDAASITGAMRMAKGIDPVQVVQDAGTAYVGSPIVNDRGEVIQGNGRTMGLQEMYGGNYAESVEKYKQFLKENAAQFGLTESAIDEMENPVLVRMVHGLDDAEAIRLGQKNATDTETGGKVRIPAQQTITQLGDKFAQFANMLLKSTEDGKTLSELIHDNGVDTLAWMRNNNYISATQYQTAVNEKGDDVTASGAEDLRAIIEETLFSGASDDNLRTKFEALPKAAQTAILASLARDVKNADGDKLIPIIQESISAFYALTTEVKEFKELKVNSKDRAETLKTAINMANMWKKQIKLGEGLQNSEKFSNFALDLAACYKAYNQKAIQEMFNAVYDKQQGTSADLFAESNKPMSAKEALSQTLNIQDNGKQTITKDAGDILPNDSRSSNEGGQGETGTTQSIQGESVGRSVVSGEPTGSIPGGTENSTGSTGVREDGIANALAEVDEELGAALDELRGLLDQTNNKGVGIVGANPELDAKILAVGTKVANLYVKKGVLKFADFCRNMLAQLGDAIRPYLQGIYLNAKVNFPELRKQMDSEDAVYDFDVENFGKEQEQSTGSQREINDEKTLDDALREAIVEGMKLRNQRGKKEQPTDDSRETHEETTEQAEPEQTAREIAANDKAEADRQKVFKGRVILAMLDGLNKGEKPFKSILDIRTMAEQSGMQVDKDGRTDILLQELVEDALVTAARSVVSRMQKEGKGHKAIYDSICKLYEMQPTISRRSSNRIKMQQYSTPLPMSYVADMFAWRGSMNQVGFEPTAGNGMLLIGIPHALVDVNELDQTRLSNLADQGFRTVTTYDATTFDSKERTYDFVVSNPPFGALEAAEYDGYNVAGLAQQIAIKALDQMKDDGRAAIIVGGNMEYSDNGGVKGDKTFYGYLYDNYNVVGVVDMAGSLYSKQGTSFPTRMILIDGRRSEAEKTETRVYPPVQSKALPKANTFEELYEIVNNAINSNEKTNGKAIVRSNGSTSSADRNKQSGQADRANSNGEHSANGSNGGQRTNVRGSESTSSSNGVGESENAASNEPKSGASDRQGADRGHTSTDGGVRSDNVPDGVREGGRSAQLESKPVEQQKREERKLDQEKLPYVRHNGSMSLESVAPSAMVEAMDEMLKQIEKEVGNIDEFVTRELGYDSVEAMHNALAAEQVDSVAMAIYQMQHGQALIIGDQTGVGKGRQMAALIRWARKQGKKPIFFTKTADLLSDIYRDLNDIGSGDLVPFVFNTGEKITDQDGNVVYKAMSSAEQKKVFAKGELPENCDYAIITYSQVNTGDEISRSDENKKQPGQMAFGRRVKEKTTKPRSDEKAVFLRKIAKGNYLFLDESHTAAGEGKGGAYLRSILGDVDGVTFASATFAKRPDTMPLYALKTVMSKANVPMDKLIEIIQKGGVALQEIMSRALTAAGQYVRRERDMSDVKTDWKTITDEETVKRARSEYDRTIKAFNAIIDFQAQYVDPFIQGVRDDLAEVMGEATKKRGTDKMGIDNVPFASKTYNYTKQLMLALKVPAIIDEVEAEIKAGRHPVIALENTMESALSGFKNGEVVDEPTFALSLLKGLDSVMQYTQKDADGNEVHIPIKPSDLSKEGEVAYYELQRFIRESTGDVFISPIDAIIRGLRERGYSVGELTGRSTYADLDENGNTVVRNRTNKDKKALAREFNSGKIDVLILNKSASTGISLHASSRFADKRQRTMIVAQPLSDINDYMQMIGRIDRTGQVHRGYYINLGLPIPAENRLMMMLSTKLKSLNANTTTSQESSDNAVEAPDLLNKYGSQVVIEYLRDNPDVYEKLGEPLKTGKGKVTADMLDDYKPQEEDARKITGYVALLSTEEQDAFYNDVVERYINLIKYLDETNNNDLKITTMPLRTVTTSKTVSSEGNEPEGNNPFAQNAYLEEVEMDILRKPMKAAEVRKTIEGIKYGGVEGRDALKRKVYDEYQAKVAAEEEKYRSNQERDEKELEGFAQKLKDKGATQDEIEKAVSAKREAMKVITDGKHSLAMVKIDAANQVFENYFSLLKPGESYLVPSSLETELFSSSSHAIFCGFKGKDEKITPSTTFAVFATLDGRQRVEVKLSDMQAINLIVKHTRDNYWKNREVNLDNWDSNVPSEARRKGYILTGNILQAVADSQDENGNYPGQLVSYTDMEGNIHDGILMPAEWKKEQLRTSGVPINARLDALKRGEILSTNDGTVRLRKLYGDFYEFVVPQTKKAGGQFFENDDIVNLTDERSGFYSRSGEFHADIPSANIDQLVLILANMGVRVMDNEADGSSKYALAKTGITRRSGEDSYAWKQRVQDELDRNCPGCMAFNLEDVMFGMLQDEGVPDEDVINFIQLVSMGYTVGGFYNPVAKKTFVFTDQGYTMDRLLNIAYNHESFHEYVDNTPSATDVLKGIAQREGAQRLSDAVDELKINRFYYEQYKSTPWTTVEEIIANANEIAGDKGITIEEVLAGTNFDVETIKEIKDLINESERRKANAASASGRQSNVRRGGQRNSLNDGRNQSRGTTEVGGQVNRPTDRSRNETGSRNERGRNEPIAEYAKRVHEQSQVVKDEKSAQENDNAYSLRKAEMPSQTKTGYACVIVGEKNGLPTMSPKMIAGESVGMPPLTNLDADTADLKKDKDGKLVLNTRGRVSLKENLAYRPGKHLAEYPNASQFELKNSPGKMDSRVMFVEVEYAADEQLHKEYQTKAWEYGFNENGKYEHTQAGLPYLPINSYYKYRTNANPNIPSMIITGAYKIRRFLTDEEAIRLSQDAGGVWLERENGLVVDEDYLREHNLDRVGLAMWAENFPYDMLEEHKDNSDEVLSQAWGYVRHKIDFNNEALRKAIAENGQSVDDYAGDYDFTPQPPRGGNRYSISMPTPTPGESAVSYANRVKEYHEQMRVASAVDSYTEQMKKEQDGKAQAEAALIDASAIVERFQDWVANQTTQDGKKGVLTSETNMYQDMFNSRGDTAQDWFRDKELRTLVDTMRKIIKSGKLDALDIRWQNIPNDEQKKAKDRIDGKRLTARDILGVYAQACDTREASELGLPDRGADGFVKNLGMTHEDIIEAVENALTPEEIAEFWDALSACTSFALDYQLKHGFITQETRDKYNRRYYVPERGWSERDNDGIKQDYINFGGGEYGAPYNKAIRQAKGRTSLASDPFAYIESIVDSSISSVEKNRTKQKLLEFCLANEEIGLESNAFKVQQKWVMQDIDPDTKRAKTHEVTDEEGNVTIEPVYILSNAAPTTEQKESDAKVRNEIEYVTRKIAKANSLLNQWKRLAADPATLPTVADVANEKIDEITQQIAELEKEIDDLKSQLHLVSGLDLSTLQHLTNMESGQHGVSVIKDGQVYQLWFRDVQLANAINQRYNDGVERLSKSRKAVRKATRAMSAVLTQYNPEFAISNFSRDFQVAADTILAEEGEKAAAQFVKNFGMSQKAVWQYVTKDKLKGEKSFADGKMGDYLKEYFESGSQTGYTYLRDIDDLRKDFDRMLTETDAKKRGKAVVNSFAVLTEWSELSCRFAGYVTYREIGKSVDEASYLSKELTTNFQRGGEWGRKNAYSLFSFMRASINGNVKFARAIKRHPFAYSGIAAAYMVIGLLNGLLNPDDPEDEVMQGEYARMSNFTIGRLKVPVAHFMRIFFGAGVNMASAIRGDKTNEQSVFDALMYAADELLPQYTNPFQVFSYNKATNQVEGDAIAWGRSFIPTIFSPIADVMLNRDFIGRVINGEKYTYKGNDLKKDILKRRHDTPDVYIKAVQGLYELLGGDVDVKNTIDDNTINRMFDVSPSAVQHIVEGYTPAAVSTVIGMIEPIYCAISGKDFDTNDVAFLRRFWSSYNPDRVGAQQQWLLRSRVEAYQSYINSLESAADGDSNRAEEKLDKLYESDRYIEMERAKELLDNIDGEEFTKENIKLLLEENRRWNKVWN